MSLFSKVFLTEAGLARLSRTSDPGLRVVDKPPPWVKSDSKALKRHTADSSAVRTPQALYKSVSSDQRALGSILRGTPYEKSREEIQKIIDKQAKSFVSELQRERLQASEAD